ncbi:MAG: sensor histidine kinase [Bdellovibrionota bacterium]
MPAVYVYFLFGTILLLAQKAIQIAWDARALGRRWRSIPLLGLAFSSFLYSSVIFASLHLHAKAASYAFFCALPVIGSFKQRSYVTTLTSYLEIEPRFLRVTKQVYTILGVGFFLGWLAWALFGIEVVLRDQPNIRTNPMLIAMGMDRFTPTLFTVASSAVFILFMIRAQFTVLGRLRRTQQRDPFLVFGIFVTLSLLVNESLGGLGFVKSFSLLFVAEGLEILRLSARLRQQAQLRIETLEQDARALAPMAQLGLFVGAIAHDIRNPLTILISGLKIVGRRLAAGESDPRASALLDGMDASAKRINEIIDRYLALAKTERPVQTDPSPLRPILIDAIGGCQNALKAVGDPRITLEVDEEICLPVNKLLLEMLFTNLISNAAKGLHGRSGPELLIRAEPRGDECLITVRDNGSGIAPEHHGKLFTQNWTTNSDGQGTGIGLRIAHQIVTAHRGRIRLVASEGGACFEIALPTTAFESPRAAVKKSEEVES